MKRLSLISLITILLFSFSSCEMNIDYLLSDYNNNFQQPPQTAEGVTPQPGDEAFFADDMLFDRYFVFSDGTLNLSAPNEKYCESIQWKMYDPEIEALDQSISPTLMKGFTTRSQRYVFYTPESGLTAGRTYQLELKVVSKDKKVYRDICEICVIKTYYTSSRTRNLKINTDLSRNILPSDKYESTDLDYWLFYKKSYDASDEGHYTKLTPYQMTNDSGHFLLNFDETCYSMILYAVPKNSLITEETISNEAVLSSRTTADFRHTSEVNFFLDSSKTTAKGRINLKLYTENWHPEANTEISVQLFDLSNNEIVNTPMSYSDIPEDSIPDTYNFTTEVAPGSYTLNINFKSYGKVYTWTDKVIVTSGCNSNAIIGIPLVMTAGRFQLKAFTEGWDITNYPGISISSSLKYQYGQDTVEILNLYQDISTINLSTSPDSIIYDVELPTGKYTLILTFSYLESNYVWSHDFYINSGQTTLDENIGIQNIINIGGASP